MVIERSAVVNVRFTPAQMALIEERARELDITTSALIRAAIGQYLFNGPLSWRWQDQ